MKGFLNGSKNPNWKGGRRVNEQGYVMLYVSYGTYRAEHRVIMEEKLGRKLHSNEDVHHIDGNKSNNSPDNLLLISDSKHCRLHSEHGKNTRFKSGRRIPMNRLCTLCKKDTNYTPYPGWYKLNNDFICKRCYDCRRLRQYSHLSTSTVGAGVM